MENIQTKQYPCFKRWSRKNWSVFASLHRYVTIGVLSVGMSILLLATQGASAQTVDTTAVLKTLRIREVGVTGSQTAPARNAQSHTPLFDRKAQAPAPVQTLEAALRLAPSVDVRERGGKGTQADIFIRGGSFDQTMVLLNGIDFTDARTGHQSHALPVDLDCISAVELIDGVPGVGAYAGAVNIRTAPLRPTYLRLEASGGQYGYGYGNLSGAVSAGRFSVLGAASYRRSDGYRHNTDFSNYNAFVRATYDGGRAGFFDLQAGWQDRDFGSNGFYAAYNPDQWEHTATALGSLRWLKTAGRFSLGAAASYRKNFDRYDWTRGTAMNRHNTDNVGAKLWADCDWAAGVTTVGGDYAFNHIYSTNLNNFIFGCTESCCFQIKYNKTICKGLPHRVFYQPFQIVHQIGFHTINDFKIIILSNCVICIRKSLYISVIGDSKCFVSPFHGTFDDIFDIRYTIHIAHLRMAMQFHTFHRTGIHTGRHKGRNLLDTDDRTDGQFAVKPVNCCHTFDFQKCTFRNPSVFDFLEIFILAEHFYHDRVGKICNRKH